MCGNTEVLLKLSELRSWQQELNKKFQTGQAVQVYVEKVNRNRIIYLHNILLPLS